MLLFFERELLPLAHTGKNREPSVHWLTDCDAEQTQETKITKLINLALNLIKIDQKWPGTDII